MWNKKDCFAVLDGTSNKTDSQRIERLYGTRKRNIAKDYLSLYNRLDDFCMTKIILLPREVFLAGMVPYPTGPVGSPF